MPNRSGSAKKKKRKEKLKKVGLLESTTPLSASGAGASTSAGNAAKSDSREGPVIVGSLGKGTISDEKGKSSEIKDDSKSVVSCDQRDEVSNSCDERAAEVGSAVVASLGKGSISDKDGIRLPSQIKDDSKSVPVVSCDQRNEVSNSCDEIAAEDNEAVDAIKEIAAHEQPNVSEERNFSRLVRLLMGVGAKCLRKYFLNIHPTWTNQPTDASALKKGALKIQKHEQEKFYSGDVKKWDVSLLINVLRFSALSSAKVCSDPPIDKALCNIQQIRNDCVAHSKDGKISGTDFKRIWKDLKLNLVTIGGSDDEIDEVLQDCTERALEQYRQLFLEEVALRKYSEQGSEKAEEVNITPEETPLEEICPPSPQWDDWLKLCDSMNSFKAAQTQFVLFADEMSQRELENFKVLAAIPWRLVIDFNPSSEDDGLYMVFNHQTHLQQVLSPFTPDEISNIGYLDLPKQIDSKRTQWLFTNGRKEDAEGSKPKSFLEWDQESLGDIAIFFACCASVDIFDNQKPIRCLVLPLSEKTLPFAESTIRRFIQHFKLYDLSLSCLDKSFNDLKISSKDKQVQTFQLSSAELKNGVQNLLNVTEDLQKYEMPCFQSGIRFPFSQKDFIYISEYLELFYIGCQNKMMNSNEEEEQKANEEEHRKCFFSGNLISFLSLFFNHDAKRVIEKDVEIHIQRMLNQMLKHSAIVQIAHPPGTGGSTIARRVLWDLHESFPCASVQLSNQTEFDEDSNFINELSCRISILEDQCGIPPVILIDGHRQWRIHALSNRLVRTLNSLGKRAIILECHRGSKPHTNADVHKVFYVDARLENTPADLHEFKEKYQRSNPSARRVFHFPLLSMIDEFREKLDGIITSTLEELDDLERDIAAFVAFLQIYAQQSTPAILLYEIFKSRLTIRKGVQVTYQSIKDCFSGTLLNLMVYQKKQGTEDDCLTHYTLQHYVVATLVFKKYRDKKKKSLNKYVYDFLQFNVPNLKRFVPLYCDLFLFNRGGNRKLRFSVLIDELRRYNPKQAAVILRRAAEIIPDPRAHGHAARFYAKMSPPKFQDAEELIAAGIELSKSQGRAKSIQDSKGVVLSLELKHKVRHKEVKDIEELENMADKALTAFRAARDFPPTFPSPLIGEVEVWILCIEWITQAHNNNADEAVKFILNKGPPFFRTCIGDSFYLLELVDKMVLSVKIIADPDEIRDRAQAFRTTLMTAVKPGIFYGKRRRNLADLLLSIDPNLQLPKIIWKESKRIKTRMLLSLYYREPLSYKPDDMKELVKLLETMVSVEKDFSFATHFLQLCLLGNGPRTYDLERGWKVCRDWLEQPDCLDPMRYYYSMVIAFVQILNGLGPSGYFSEYKSLVQKLKNASRGHCRRNTSLHFLKKHGDGISQLISHQSLLSDQSSYKAENSDVVKSFWMVDSRRKLKECTGRLRVKVEGTKKVTKIELLEGDIELYVGKYAEIGIPGKDFDKDAKVYFVVSFNLGGPVANGITFHPTVEQKKNGASVVTQ